MDWYNDSADSGDSPHPPPHTNAQMLTFRLETGPGHFRWPGPGQGRESIKISKYNCNNITTIDAKYHRNELMLFRQVARAIRVIYGRFAYILLITYKAEY